MINEKYGDEIQAELLDIVQHSPVIYKFLSFETAKLVISHSTIGFKSPWEFNDPYDFFEGLVDFENIPNGYREYLIDKFFVDRPEAEKKVKLAEMASVSDEIAIAYVKRHGMFNEVKNRGVSCFSRKHDHMLMWAHYAESHKGVCIGFNLLSLYVNVARYSDERMIALVNYVEKLQPLNFFTNKGEAIIRWMKTKAVVWSYEEEIRIILNGLDYQGKDIFIADLELRCFNSIYLGSMMSEENQNIIKLLVRQKMPFVDIYKMQRESDSFLLKASLLNE